VEDGTAIAGLGEDEKSRDVIVWRARVGQSGKAREATPSELLNL
jgi:hypothetical protein